MWDIAELPVALPQSTSHFLLFPSGSLCIIQTDHLPLEELHAARLSGLPAFEECKWQEESAT